MNPGDLLTQYYNTPELQQAQKNAQGAAQTASDYSVAGSLLPQKLREAIQSKLDYNKDIISEQQKAMANYFSAPATARSDYQNVWNPFDREKLVSQAVSNAYAPYATLTNVLGQRQGQINDIVNAGVGAFNAGATQAQNAAQIAQQSYSDQMSLADKLASIAQWSYEQTHKGSGSSLSPIEQLLQDQLYGKIIGGGVEPRPTYGMNKASVGDFSPQGQWMLTNDGWDQVQYVD